MPTVHEITIAAPDIVCAEVRDPFIERGVLEALDEADAGSYNSWLDRNGDKAMVVGPEKMHLRYQDVRATEYLDRVAAVVAEDYGPIGARTVTDVYLHTMPYCGGEGAGAFGTTTTKYTSSRHLLYLKLDGNLAEGGPYTIEFPPDTGLAEASFSYNTKVTRARALKTTQVGHRRDDADKYAYLALWIPKAPNEGAVDLLTTYGLSTFHVIDATGAVYFTGSVVQRVAPTDAEPNTGNNGDGPFTNWSGVDNKINYVSTNEAPIAVTSVTRGSTTTIGASAHGLANGTKIRMNDFITGTVQLNNQVGIVADTATNSFRLLDGSTGLDLNSSGYTAYTSGGKIHKTHLANRAGTYVFGLDYSAWQPNTDGEYWIWTPGLGRGDKMVVDQAHWFRVAKCAAKGEYHHRSGITLDGRFGYTRPIRFKTGEANQTIYKSTLPLFWTGYGGMLDANNPALEVVPVSAAQNSPWITGTVHTDAWGGWDDAGDWDSVISDSKEAFQLLDVYEQMPEESRELDFGLPKSSEVLDPVLYAGTDDLSDLIHSAIWSIDFHRRLQEPSGAVSPGITYNRVGDTLEGDQTSDMMEPSWLLRGNLATYHPDHFTTFVYAGIAAKLAKVLGDLGHTALAATYEASAVLAWDWAESIYDLGDATARDAFYLDAKTKAGWETEVYNTNMASIQAQVAPVRLFAAACLFRLTGDSDYSTIFEAAWPITEFYDMGGNACWEYSNAVGADAEIRDAIREGVQNYADNILAHQNSDVAYRSLRYPGFADAYGQCGTDLRNIAPKFIWAHKVSGDAKYIKALQAAEGWIHGANQNGLSYTTGLGHRWTNAVLHQDTRMGGGAYSGPPDGITYYGPSFVGPFYGKSLNFGSGALQNIVENPSDDPDYALDFEHERTLEPARFALPQYEALYENAHVIIQMEYTMQQCIVPQYFIAAYLHGVGPNAFVALRTHRRMSFGA